MPPSDSPRLRPSIAIAVAVSSSSISKTCEAIHPLEYPDAIGRCMITGNFRVDRARSQSNLKIRFMDLSFAPYGVTRFPSCSILLSAQAGPASSSDRDEARLDHNCGPDRAGLASRSQARQRYPKAPERHPAPSPSTAPRTGCRLFVPGHGRAWAADFG